MFEDTAPPPTTVALPVLRLYSAPLCERRLTGSIASATTNRGVSRHERLASPGLSPLARPFSLEMPFAPGSVQRSYRRRTAALTPAVACYPALHRILVYATWLSSAVGGQVPLPTSQLADRTGQRFKHRLPAFPPLSMARRPAPDGVLLQRPVPQRSSSGQALWPLN